jgi:hypothetical protein
MTAIPSNTRLIKKSKSESKSMLCYDRRSVGQSILVSSTHLGPKTRFFVTVRHLRVSWLGAPSLTRQVCRLKLPLALANAVILTSTSRGTPDHILICQIGDSPNLEVQVPIFISPRNRVAQLYPHGTGFPPLLLLLLAWLQWRYSNPPPQRLWLRTPVGSSYRAWTTAA